MFTPDNKVEITEICAAAGVRLFMKREDQIHPEISGNKFWKLFYNLHNYLERSPREPLIITFGGAFSNHIAAVAAAGRELNVKTLGLIRGEELADIWQQNPTLVRAAQNGMSFRFTDRTAYKNKEKLEAELADEFPDALILPEGGTNQLAVEGVAHMLDHRTAEFDYLCAAVGTGGTVAGLLRASGTQKIAAFDVVGDPAAEDFINKWSGGKDFNLIESRMGGYGKISELLVRFINNFKEMHQIQLDPIYTGKMMYRIFELIENGYFPQGSKILAFHTGGLQGLSGANDLLKKKNRELIKI